MNRQPREALAQFVAALERHFEAMSMKHGGSTAAVEHAYEALKDAFLDYEEAVDEAFEEWLPFELADNEEEAE
ncbi:MAG: hypothetical protein ACKOWJ_00100 [Micrococcales bacterium]